MTRRASYFSAAFALAAPCALMALTASAQTPAGGRGAPAPAAVAAAPNTPGVFIDGAKLEAKLVEATKANANASSSPAVSTDRYAIGLVRRGAPNTPIAHTGWAELMYIVDGSGTLTTGTGATAKSQTVSKGDAVLIPPSTLHGYSTVTGSVTYLEARVADPTLVTNLPKQPAAQPSFAPVVIAPATTPAPAPLSAAQYHTAKDLMTALDAATKANPAVSVSPIALTDRYNFQLAHRGTAGAPAIHEGWSELHYIVDGSGVLTTGGTVVNGPDGKPTIQGGVSQAVHKGDSFFLPPNVPHAYSQVDGNIVYLEIRMADPTMVTGLPKAP